MIKLNPFQKSPSFMSWKGLTKDNHIGAMYHLEPQKVDKMWVQLAAYNRGAMLDTWLSQKPTRYFDNDTEYYWNILGNARKNISLVEARDEFGNAITSSSSGMVGVNTAPFTLVFGENWFADGEVIFGNLNQVYPMRVLGEARLEGTNYAYKVELMGGNSQGIPVERLLRGEKFSVEYAPVEKELSRKVGDVRFSTPVSMRNEWSVIRIQHKVPGNKINRKLAVGIPMVKRDASGKQVIDTSNYWMHYVEWEVEMQFNDYKNSVLAFGTSNRNGNGEYMNFGKSGNVIQTGAGLYEQIDSSNAQYYTDFSLELLENIILQLATNKLEFADREFLVRTGEYGMMQASKAIANTVSGWTMYAINADSLGVISKVQSPISQTALKAGGQFVEYLGPNNCRIRFEVDPMYDDEVRNKIMHPNGGCAMSYRYDIFYTGRNINGEPNIQKCAITGEPDLRGYEWGLRNPFTGQRDNMYMSHDEDSATIHRMSTLGVMVADPTQMVSLIPAILEG